MNLPIYKIVVLGEGNYYRKLGRVGKTSMSLKYVHNRFDDKEQSSINASYLEGVEEIENGKIKVKLAIWDTAGQEKYNAIAPVYYRDAVGAIVVYDITFAKSFEKVKKWVTELEQHGPRDIVITIAGNKSDMEHQRQVNHQEAEQFAKEHNAKHYIVSAKNGSGIKQVMKNIAEKIYKSKINDSKMISMSGRKKNPRLKIDQKQQKKLKKDKKQCCS